MGLTQSFLGSRPFDDDCHSSATKQLDLSESKAFSSGNFVRTQGGLFFAVSSAQWRDWELASDILSKVLAIPNTFKLRSADGIAVVTVVERDELLELRKTHGVRLPPDYFGANIVVSQVIAFIRHCDSDEGSVQARATEDAELSPPGEQTINQRVLSENEETESSMTSSDGSEEADNEEPSNKGGQHKSWWRTLGWWGKNKVSLSTEYCGEDAESVSGFSGELTDNNDNRISCSSDSKSRTSDSHLASNLEELSSSHDDIISEDGESASEYQDVVSGEEDEVAPDQPEYGNRGRINQDSPLPAASIILRRRLRDSVGEENIQPGKEQEMLKTLLDLHPSTQIALDEPLKEALRKDARPSIHQANWRHSVLSANSAQKPIRRLVDSVQGKVQSRPNLSLDSDSENEKLPPRGRVSALISKAQPFVVNEGSDENSRGILPDMWSNFVVASDEEGASGNRQHQPNSSEIAGRNGRTPKKSSIRSSARNRADDALESAAARVTRSGRCRY